MHKHKSRVTYPIYEAIHRGERYFVVMPAACGIQTGDELVIIASDFKFNSKPGDPHMTVIVTHISAEKQLDGLIIGFLPKHHVEVKDEADRLEESIQQEEIKPVKLPEFQCLHTQGDNACGGRAFYVTIKPGDKQMVVAKDIVYSNGEPADPFMAPTCESCGERLLAAHSGSDVCKVPE